MIPKAYINEWQRFAPWASEAQIEQDLVLSRAIIEIFSHPLLANTLAFRDGTALHKLFIHPAARYSEDIDLVQIHEGPIGPMLPIGSMNLEGSTAYDIPSDVYNPFKDAIHVQERIINQLSDNL